MRGHGEALMYLTGGISQSITAAIAGRSDVGLLLQPGKHNRPVDGIPWAADNGCFSTRGAFDEDRWLDWLEAFSPHAASCLFAVAPDVVGNAVATRDRSALYLDTIRAFGYAVAFVTQDGATEDLVPWGLIDTLFVGGSTPWKFSDPSISLCREAHRRGLRVHVGRVNSLRRMRHAQAIGADSVDGTHLAFRPDRYLPVLLRWLDAVNAQPSLLEVAS